MVKSATLPVLCPYFHVSPKDRLTHYFLETRDELLRFLRRRTGRQAAEDVLHDVWLKLREGGDPAAWREPRAVLFTTAANLATDAGRRNAVAQKYSTQEVPAEDTACARAGPEAQLEIDYDLKQLNDALMQLPQACRDAFLLNRLEAMTHEQIAMRLGISTRSARRYIERAMSHCLLALDP